MKSRVKGFYCRLFSFIGIILAGGIFLWFFQKGRASNIPTQPANYGHHDRAAESTAGLSDDRLVEVLIEHGIDAVQKENLKQCMNLFSSEYRDSLGFTVEIMRKLIKKAYKEFDEPKIFIQKPPAIFIDGSKAVLRAKVRMSVIYTGKRNYILGDENTYNAILVNLKKNSNGWKVTRIEDLRPLGFESQFLRYLGTDLGLEISRMELDKGRKYCMPCRLKMKKRFDPTY